MRPPPISLGLLFYYIGHAYPYVLVLWSLYLMFRGGWLLRWRQAKFRLDQMQRYEVGFGTPSPKTIASMDRGVFRDIQEKFEALEFHPLGDYVIGGGTTDEVSLPVAPLASPTVSNLDGQREFRFAHVSVCRVFVHADQKCIAAIASPLTSSMNQQPGEQHFLIASANGEWTYTSCDGEAPSVDMGNSAHDLASFEGDVAPAQLFQNHLSRRDEVARAGNFSWGEPLSVEQVTQWERRRYERIQQWASTQTPLSLLRAEKRGQRHPQRELLGALQGKL